MAINPKSKKNLKPFQNGDDDRRNLNGRPPKLISHITSELKEKGYEPVSNAQILEAYTLLINLDEASIKEIITNNDHPMFLRIVAKAMLGQKGTEMIEKILERAYGKAIQSVDHTSKGEKLNQQPILFLSADRLTDEQIQQYLTKDAGNNDESI
jgi:hypothetical protein